MTTLEAIRQTGARIAFDKGIFGNKKIEEIVLPNRVIEDFIGIVITDLHDFNTLEQFDHLYFNLFNRAFMYVYGKGAEITFFSRLGNAIPKINYEFDKAMQGVCGEMLPEHLRFCTNRKSSAMLEMYYQMFQHTKGSQERIISEGLTFDDCISTILYVAFFCGVEICLTTELLNEDKQIAFNEGLDKLYDPDNYDQKYSINDYKVVNFNITQS